MQLYLHIIVNKDTYAVAFFQLVHAAQFLCLLFNFTRPSGEWYHWVMGDDKLYGLQVYTVKFGIITYVANKIPK